MGVSHVALANHDRSLGHDEEQAVSATPVAILDPPERTLKVVIQVLDADVVFRDDNGVPTATRGLIIPAGDILILEADRAVMDAMTAVALSGTARIRVAYYGY